MSFSTSNLTLVTRGHAVFSSGTVIDFIESTQEIRTLLIDKPRTPKRTKPLDLWGSGTDRTTYSIVNEPGTCVYTLVRSAYTITYTGDSLQMRANIVSRFDMPPVSFDILLNKVRSKAREDVVNLAQALAEYRQTAQLFGDLTKSLVTLTRAVLTRRPQLLLPKKSWSKTTANIHLQYIYGVTPLLSDLQGSVELLNKSLNQVLRLHGKVVIKGDVTSSIVAASAARNASDGFMSGTGTARCTHTLSKKVAYRVTFNTSVLSSTMASLGFTNPLALLYELTPYSFVFDWWFNVGDVLQSLDSGLIIDTLMVRESYSINSATITIIDKGDFKGECRTFERSTVRNVPRYISPVLTFAYKPSVSLQHIANGLALITSVLGRK